MASSLSNIVAKDGTPATIVGGILAVDKSGAGTGPFFTAQTIVDTQGVNTATVKAASTAPAATDTSIVIAPNPNSVQMGLGATTAITQRVAIASDSVNTNVTNASDAVTATTNTAAPVVNYGYGFNGATWDRLQVDGSKNLKIALASTTITGTTTTKEVKSATGTQTIVASSATSVTVLASNANRLGATVYNDSTQILFLLLTTGGTASNTVYTVQMVAAAYYEVPFGYTGALIGIWASANGNARVMEMT